MKNIDKFKQMSSDDLAEYLYYTFVSDCSKCPCDQYNHRHCFTENPETTCVDMVKKWLEKEYRSKEFNF